MNSEITKEIPAPVSAEEWHPLAASARNVFIGVSAISFLVISIILAGIFVIIADNATGLQYAGVAVLMLLLPGIASLIAYKRWRNTFWKLDDEALHVRHGKTWFKQTCLPRSRVQHLDFERGPLERRYGLATLVVHTAGSHERALRQSGLSLADAEFLRDVLVPKDHRHGQ
ncbi:MAG: PH domain-containing protein [Arenimonas sp.]